MQVVRLHSPQQNASLHSIALPTSKSESNRALIIQALAKEQSNTQIQLENLAAARDTQTMQHVLFKNPVIWDVKDAGTTMRFLTAYAAITGKKVELTGTQRMQERPIGILVDALRKLGFQISYLKKDGFPPLKIESKNESQAQTHQIDIQGNVSSQFISALLMIAPLLPNGLELNLIPPVFSQSYIQMTLNLMQHFRIEYQWEGNQINIRPQTYQASTYQIEGDWSGASYWYSLVGLSTHLEIHIKGLKENSWQGDSVVQKLVQDLGGVKSIFDDKGVLLKKNPDFILPKTYEFDFKNCPDLAQTIVVFAFAKGISLKAYGLESLKIKETDRITALQTELQKMQGDLIEHTDHWEVIPNPDFQVSKEIATYDDHRMAMAFAPLSTLREIQIQEPSVVAKSYPSFWQDWEQIGFEVQFSQEQNSF